MKFINQLSEDELAELKGGLSLGDARDVTNLNTSNSCRCYYINQTAVVNSNSTDWCQCVCLRASEKTINPLNQNTQ